MLKLAKHENFSASEYENANSAEHEIFHANKSQITYNCQFFLAKTS